MLSDIKIKSLKSKDKIYNVTDERGLSIEVPPKGTKRWRFKYRYGGKQKRLSLGTYPEVSLKKARDRRDELREQIADGIDPAIQRKVMRFVSDDLNSFEVVACEWHQKNRAKWSEGHSERTMARLTNDVFPWLGKQALSGIKPIDVLKTLQKIESRGALETAHRVRGIIGQVFRYGVATARAENDITIPLKDALPAVKKRHHASITDQKAVGELMRAIEDYHGNIITKYALKLAPLVFVRPGELRHAEWSEFDLEQSEWRIPAEKMKMKTLHIVPLSNQALSLIKELKNVTGKGRYLFPSVHSKARPMSDNTINTSLRRMGYTKEEMTAHGFRSMASTILNELGWNRDAIERQLAHSERNGVRAAYNYAEYLPERKKMMQAWADHLDGLAS